MSENKGKKNQSPNSRNRLKGASDNGLIFKILTLLMEIKVRLGNLPEDWKLEKKIEISKAEFT